MAVGASLFKALVLGALCNLLEISRTTRSSISCAIGCRPGRFLGLRDRVPDAKTVWLYRAGLAQAGMVEALFNRFDGFLARQGYIARGGQILRPHSAPGRSVVSCVLKDADIAWINRNQ
jgi:hypothetical protein